MAGSGCEVDTIHYLGDKGIFECSSLLDELKIPRPPGKAYAASHARAIADLVLAAVINNGSPDFIPLDDWMPYEHNKKEVFDLINLAIQKLDSSQTNKIRQWLQKNSI